MSISPIVILIWSISLLILGLSLLILIGSTRLSSKIFSLSIFTVSLWMAGVGMLILIQNVDYAIYNIRINYYLGNLIANMFYLFFIVFPDKKSFPKKIIPITFFIQLVLFFIYIFLLIA